MGTLEPTLLCRVTRYEAPSGSMTPSRRGSTLVSASSSNLLGRRARCRLHAADPGDVLVSSGARDLLAQRIHSTDWETRASHRWLGDYPRSLEREGTVQEGLFTKGLFTFLKDLQRHNDRAWFAENKER